MTDELELATVDFRDFDFETLAELDKLVHDVCLHFATEHDNTIVGGIVITETQQKKLRLERYLAGVPEKIIKSQLLDRVHGVPVVITEFEKGCPGCGDNVQWH